MKLKKNTIYLFRDKIYEKFFELTILDISKTGDYIKVRRPYCEEWVKLTIFAENAELIDEVC